MIPRRSGTDRRSGTHDRAAAIAGTTRDRRRKLSDYQRVKEALSQGVSPDVLCATCPWDRLCVTPPVMSAHEIEQHLAAAEAKDLERDPSGSRMPAHMLMTAMAIGGRDQMGALCPAFALRLRGPDGRDVADGIRALMRGS